MIIVNRKDNSIVQQISSSISPITMNGRYMLDEPDFVKATITPSSTVTSLKSSISSALLSTYSTYTGVIYDFLLTDFTNIDTTQGFFQIGAIPNTLAVNRFTYIPTFFPGVYTEDPGVVYTNNITIPGAGSDKFMVYWRFATLSYTDDISPVVGQANQATQLQYDLTEPTNAEVHISVDNGVTYTQVNKLESISYASAETLVKLKFVNNSSNKLHLLAFAILYV